MKSFLDVLSQSQTAINNRLSLSSSVSSLRQKKSQARLCSNRSFVTYMVNFSNHWGFNVARTVRVLYLFSRFFFVPSDDVVGISLILTYGSLKPLGSIGIKFRLSIISTWSLFSRSKEIRKWIRPRRSVWSRPQRSGTNVWHFLWTFISQHWHFRPWCMSPYKRDPQWSQNVGEVYVWMRNLWLYRGA